MSTLAIDPSGTSAVSEVPIKNSRVAERVTVNLTEKTAVSLAKLADLTGETKTEAINKALQVYDLLQTAQSQGGEIWLKDSAKSELSRVRFY